MSQSEAFMVRAVTICLILAGSVPAMSNAAQPVQEKPRVVVTTDGEIDDRSSFVRFLMYSSDFDVEGIIATNSIWQKEGHGTDWIFRMIDRYEEVYPNLLLHRPDFPSPDRLRGRVFLGNEDRLKMHGVGPENDSSGSNEIMRILLDDDERPVWLLAWGGTNTIAQALWRLKTSSPAADFERAAQKARIYAVAVQDQSIWGIRQNMSEVTLALSYQYKTLDYRHEGHPLSGDPIFDPDWMTTNVKEGHGGLGAAYPQAYFSEGDSPSFFHLIATGLRNLDDLSFGGWGGRFVRESATYPKFWTDAEDDGDKLKPLWRWLIALENDFAARMDWSVASYEEANHPPLAMVAGAADRTVAAGETVQLNARASSDPDGDPVTFSWWQYRDAGTYPEWVELRHADTPEAWFVAPAVEEPQTVHIVLALEDAGIPSLTRYRRIIITIVPDA